MDPVHIVLAAIGGVVFVAVIAIGVATRADAINRALDRRDLP